MNFYTPTYSMPILTAGGNTFGIDCMLDSKIQSKMKREENPLFDPDCDRGSLDFHGKNRLNFPTGRLADDFLHPFSSRKKDEPKRLERSYVYVSYESAAGNPVYFDDMKVTVEEHPVIQRDDYYPFGLTFNSWQRSSTALKNKMNTFQDQELITDLDLNWVKFKWRNHDPTIGRFFNIDPIAEDYYYNSPYAFSENNVTGHIELEGLEKLSVIDGKMVFSTPPDATRTVVKPFPMKKKYSRPVETVSIGRNSIYHPNFYSPVEKASHLGVDLGESVTGIYALKNVPKLIKHLPKLVKSLTQSKAAIDDGAEAAMKAYSNIDEVWSGCDCSEIAEDIYKQVGDGSVLELTNEGGIKVLQNGVEESFDYHQVYTKDGYVYDPRYNSEPVKFDDYINALKKNNDNLIVNEVNIE